jgi:ABC-2 type transport system permease protein
MIVDQALRGAPAAYSIPDLCCMAAFQILPLLVLPRLRRIALDSSYWGKM